MLSCNRYLLIILCLLGVSVTEAQSFAHFDTLTIPVNYKPEFRRQINHDAIDAEQREILSSDGKADLQYSPSEKAEINQLLTRAIVSKTDWLQYNIETDPGLDHRLRVFYLSGLEKLLKYFRQNWKQPGDRGINPLNLSLIIDAFEMGMKLERNGQTIEHLINDLPYDAGTTIINAGIFDKNPGYQTSRNGLVLKLYKMHPDRVFPLLQQYPDVPFADSLLHTIDKRKFARQFYDYAAASNKLGVLIRTIQDDIFIKTIATMALSRSGQQYFPFLDNIVNGRMTLREIDEAKDDSLLYYRLLVKTQMDYAARAVNKDTAFEFKALTQRLETKAADFVNIINGLHVERNLDIRFRTIQPLTAQELYYLAVTSDGAIYTSSFVKGVYPLMMKKINNRGDSLLVLLNFDKYRKFIKMTAGFNQLDMFLASFAKSNDPEQEDPANTLMRAFVNRLEQSDGLEDGVDVADSYASITETLKPVAERMLLNIQDNYERNLANGNKKGIAIYHILGKLFESADSTKNIDLTKELGVPPVYEVPFNALTSSDSGRVILQLFIYGDKDGMGVFPTLLSMFNNPNWKTDLSNKQWVTISSAKGKPVTLYMNRPLPEETNEDALAQEALCKYLESSNIIPTVTINRGHSYNAPYTIEQMSSASKIVFMGSCGGYRMIHDILEKAPDAHIIGTKQIADAPVNNPFLKLIMEKLRTGSDIKWIPFWEELGKLVTDKVIFEDYVPPYKNLGALFIKAYTRAMGPEKQNNQ